jgi:hypothetical protein
MTKKTIVFATAAILACLGSCKRASVLKPADTALRSAAITADGYLQIEGGMMHSGMEIEKISTDRQDSRVFVRVYLRPVQAGGPADFKVRVAIPPGVDEVWLGDPPSRTTVGALFGLHVRLPKTVEEDARPVWRRTSPSVHTPAGN